MAGKSGRRGHNDGGIYQRSADGRWVGAVSLGWEGGKRKRKVVYGDTRAEVSQKVIRIQAELEKGLPVQTAGTTMSKLLDDWLAQSIKPSRSHGTYVSYAGIVTLHLKPAIGKHKVDKLTQRNVLTLMNEKLAAGLSPTTVNQIRAVLRASLNQAMKWDLVGRNVAALTPPLRTEQREGHIFTADQLRDVVKASADTDFEALFAVETATGLRMGELMGLRWRDADLDTGSLQVRHQGKVIDGAFVLAPLKTKASRRTIPLSSPVVSILKRHRRSMIAKGLEYGQAWTEDWFVFGKPGGSPALEDQIRMAWHDVKARASLPETVRFHDLRHGALTLLAARGTPLRTLMGIAGHTNPQTTMQIYAHLDDASARSSMDLTADIYGTEKESS
jgi:integrase